MKKTIFRFGSLMRRGHLIKGRPKWKRQKRMEKRFWKSGGKKGYLVGV